MGGLPPEFGLGAPFFQRNGFAASGSVRRLGVSFVVSGFMRSALADSPAILKHIRRPVGTAERFRRQDWLRYGL